MKHRTPEQKLAWLKAKRDYWWTQVETEYSARAQSKLDYYTDKVRYWETRIAYCGHGAADPTSDEHEAIAQQLQGGQP